MKNLILGIVFILFITVILFITKSSPRALPVSPITQVSLPTNSPQPSTSPQEWTLLLTGDIIPARVTNQKMVQKQDFYWPLASIAATLRNADITLSDLESPLLSDCPVTNEGFTFCGDAHFAQSLHEAGVDIVNLANNHSLNFGWEGILETQKHLEEQNIFSTGFTAAKTNALVSCEKDTVCSGVTIITTHGMKIGFLGYNAVGQILHEDVIRPQVEALKPKVDLIVLSVHWGKEYSHEPIPDASLAPDDPNVWGKKFIDMGVDVVAGNHPHWYQSVEWYKSKPIFYAMGNTVFDQEWSIETKRSFLAKLTFHGKSITPDDIEYFPTGIRDWGQTYLLEGKEKAEILQFLQQ